MRKLVFAVSALLLSCGLASAARLTVFCPGAVQSIVVPLANKFAHSKGDTIQFRYGTAGAIAKDVANGAQGDVVIGASSQIQKLASEGKVISDSIIDLGAMGVGVAVRKGATKPDIHNVKAFKATLLAAHSIMFANPAKGGQSGIHIAKILADLGIAEQLAPKVQLRDRSPDGLKEVAAGKIDIGLGQLSEILANKGVTLVGPLPPPLQDQLVFSAAVDSGSKEAALARELIHALVAPSAKRLFKSAGFVVE